MLIGKKEELSEQELHEMENDPARGIINAVNEARSLEAKELEKSFRKERTMISFDEYQAKALSTAVYPDLGQNLVYPAMGLAGEAGEFLDKVKKNWRNNNIMSSANLSPEQRKEFAKEIGDVLWYAAAAARELGYELSEIAIMNIEKLADRRARGVIKSEGDNR